MYMGSLTLGIVVFTAIINIFLGLLVLLKNPSSATNRLITALAIIFSAWSVFNYFSLNSVTADATLFWIRMVMVATAPLGPTVALALKAFPSSELAINKKILYGLLISTVIVSILALTPFVFSGVTLSPTISPTPNFGILFYVVLFIGSLIYGIVVTVKKYRKAKGVSKLQFKYLFIGVILTFALQVLTNFIAVVLFNFSGLVALGPSFSLIFVGLISYAIIKHRLLDIRLALRRGLAQLLIAFTILAIFIVAGIMYASLNGLKFDTNLLFVFIFVAFLLSFIYDSVSYYLRKATDKYLFTSLYTPSELLRELSIALNSTLDFEEVLKNVYGIINNNLHISSIAFAVKLQGRKNISNLFPQSDFAIYEYGDKNKKLIMVSILADFLKNTEGAVVFEDLQRDLAEIEEVSKRKIYEWMTENEVGIVLPLKVKNEVIGAVMLGEKLSGDAFTSEDVDVLETFALQASIGIENILLFMHSRDFGERLKIEVEKATAELKQKNKNLEILRHMENIITTTLDLKEMCQKIVDTISWELGYEGALISLVDPKRNVLVPTAVSQTPTIKKALAILPAHMEDIVMPLTEKKSMAVQALDLRTKITTISLADAFAPGLPRPVSDAIQKLVGMKGMITYPLYSKDKPLGVLALAMHVSPRDVPFSEMNVLDAFMDEVGIALENSYLYEEAKTANDALEVSNQKLIELDKMKDEFVSVASHELRTPMTAINGYVWMLLNGKGGELQEKQRYYLQRVAQSTQRLINLVNDMLTISRIEGGRTKIENKNFELVDLLKAVNEELQIKADEKGIKLGLQTEDVVHVFADQDKVHEVLINLIGNSLKFTEQGSITTTVLDKGDYVAVSVNDTGKGIAAEDMPKLFTKFGRLDNQYATVAQTAGTGLGLYICKKYIDGMGGTVSVTSTVGKGSTFTFTLKKAL